MSMSKKMDSAKPEYKDIWAAVVFILQFLTFFAVAMYYVSQYIEHKRDYDGFQKNPADIIWKFFVSLAIAVFTTVLFFVSILYATKITVYTCLILPIVCCIALGIFGLIQGNVMGGIINIFLALLFGLVTYLLRDRIKFAIVMIRAVCKVINSYRGIYWLIPGFITFSFGVAMLLVYAFIGADLKASSQHESINGGLVIFLLFSFFWTNQVLKNIVSVTVSGVVATFYFVEGSGQAVKDPTVKSLRRALTYSFGSICFGSLLVAIFKTLRSMLGSSSKPTSLCSICCICILKILESAIQYFNGYAFAQIAIYGKSYMEAARDTWKLAKSRGVDAILNDLIVDRVFYIASTFLALACGFIAFFISIENFDLYEVVLVVIFAIVSSLFLMDITSEMISGGVITLFVCIAENSEVLRATKPKLYQKIAAVYPQVTGV